MEEAAAGLRRLLAARGAATPHDGDSALREQRNVAWCCDALEHLVRLGGRPLPIAPDDLHAALWADERELLALEKRDGVWHVRAR